MTLDGEIGTVPCAIKGELVLNGARTVAFDVLVNIVSGAMRGIVGRTEGAGHD